MFTPPAPWMMAMCSDLATLREPWNMKCSNRCAKPVLPSCSCLEPTSYQRLTATDRREVVGRHDDTQPVGEAAFGEADDGQVRSGHQGSCCRFWRTRDGTRGEPAGASYPEAATGGRPVVAPGTPASLIARVVDGDADALGELEPSLAEYRRNSVREFLAEVEPSIKQMRQSLGAWLVPFAAAEDRIGRLMLADVASRATANIGQSPEAVIERTTGGLRFMPEPHIRRVILAPSFFGRPYNYIYQGSDWRLFCYPVSDDILETADGVTPPPSMVRLYRALGDPTRMRVLKLLVGRDWYLTELATQLELTKPTMKHHLAILRSAGLVTVTEEGALTYYSLRRERLDEAGLELRHYLG